MDRVHSVRLSGMGIEYTLNCDLNGVVFLYHQCDQSGREGGGEMGDWEGQAGGQESPGEGSGEGNV